MVEKAERRVWLEIQARGTGDHEQERDASLRLDSLVDSYVDWIAEEEE